MLLTSFRRVHGSAINIPPEVENGNLTLHLPTGEFTTFDWMFRYSEARTIDVSSFIEALQGTLNSVEAFTKARPSFKLRAAR